MVEGIDLTIEDLKAQLNEIKQRISQFRKKGLDTKIVQLKIMSIPSKIKMVEATKDYKDVKKITNMINDAKAEVRSLEKESLNIENEIEDNQLKNISILMEKIDVFLNVNKIKEAKENYLECINIYKNLPQENKKDIFNKLNELRIRISRG